MNSLKQGLDKSHVVAAAVVLSLCVASPLLAASTLDSVATETVKSMADRVPAEYATLAVWKIGDRTGTVNLERLQDKLEIRIINSRHLKLIDRKKLNLILKEQHFTHSGLVDPATMKRFGQVSGVRAFLYGNVVSSSGQNEDGGRPDQITVVLKLVATKTAHVVWADRISGSARQVKEPPASKYVNFAKTLADGLDKKLAERDKRVILDFAQLEKQPRKFFDASAFMDALVVALANSKKCVIVDRKNLDVLFKEQNLVLDGIVTKKERDRLSKLWGIGGFIYGKVWRCTDQALEASLKVIDSETGEVFFGAEIQAKGAEVAQAPKHVDPKEELTERLKAVARCEVGFAEAEKLYRPDSEKVKQAKAKLAEAEEQVRQFALDTLLPKLRALCTQRATMAVDMRPEHPKMKAITLELASCVEEIEGLDRFLTFGDMRRFAAVRPTLFAREMEQCRIQSSLPGVWIGKTSTDQGQRPFELRLELQYDKATNRISGSVTASTPSTGYRGTPRKVSGRLEGREVLFREDGKDAKHSRHYWGVIEGGTMKGTTEWGKYQKKRNGIAWIWSVKRQDSPTRKP